MCPKEGQDPFYVVRKLLLLQHGEEVRGELVRLEAERHFGDYCRTLGGK